MARKTKGLRQRDTFVIFTNGKETEKNYFTELRDYRHSIYDIKIKFESADPKGLLLRAIKELKTANANKVWIVFDKDEFPNLNIDAEVYKKKTKGTVVNHIFEKILRLKDLMLTEKGKKEAIRRYDFLVNFLSEYFYEEDVPNWQEYLDNYTRKKIKD